MTITRRDVIIIGAGPAGLSAAVNAASEGLSVTIIESQKKVGGQAKFSSAIENYLGFPSRITGQQLAMRAARQAAKFGAEILVQSEVRGISTEGADRIVTLADGRGAMVARSIIVACGLQWRILGAHGEDKFGRNVFYGGDKNLAHHYRGKDVIVVGGGNSAGQAALYWARFARRVTLVARHSLDSTMSAYLSERLGAAENVEVVTGASVESLVGSGAALEVCGIKGKGWSGSARCDVVLPLLGSIPRTEFARGVCHCDEDGYLLEARVPGVFFAGDCRKGGAKRIAVAVGDGSQCVSAVHEYLKNL